MRMLASTARRWGGANDCKDAILLAVLVSASTLQPMANAQAYLYAAEPKRSCPELRSARGQPLLRLNAIQVIDNSKDAGSHV